MGSNFQISQRVLIFKAGGKLTACLGLGTHFPEQAGELKGIATEFEGLPRPIRFIQVFGIVGVLSELAHTELNANSMSEECTGLLAMDTSEKVHHVANMDQSPVNIRNVTLRSVHQWQRISSRASLLVHNWDSRMVMQDLASVQENWRPKLLVFLRFFQTLSAA